MDIIKNASTFSNCIHFKKDGSNYGKSNKLILDEAWLIGPDFADTDIILVDNNGGSSGKKHYVNEQFGCIYFTQK